MNELYIGFKKQIDLPPKGFLYVNDDIPEMSHARIFDPLRHSFNPLTGITYKKARALADVLYSITLQGETTLTVRNGKRALTYAFLHSRRLDLLNFNPRPQSKAEQQGIEDAQALITDLLLSPVLRTVFCTRTNFSFNPTGTILAQINRGELGDFDALVLGLVLINHFQGQRVIPDLGFYGRDAHASLVREDRLIAGVYHLAELPLRLRNTVLLIDKKYGQGALYDDAQLLARFEGLKPDPSRQMLGNPFDDYVEKAMHQ